MKSSPNLTPTPSPRPFFLPQSYPLFASDLIATAGTAALTSLGKISNINSLSEYIPSCSVTFYGPNANELPTMSLTENLVKPLSSGCEVFVVAAAAYTDFVESGVSTGTEWSQTLATTSVTVLISGSSKNEEVRVLAGLLGEGGAGTFGGNGLVGGGGSTNSTIPTVSIAMLPSIVEGLLITFGLIFFILIGVSCIMSVQTPDILHSFHLPAGKEY